MNDFSYALRGLRRTPVSGAVIILLLALGIGANTIIFGLIDAQLLRPLPIQRRFFARSMAGISMGISIRTAQDLLAKKENEKLKAIYRLVCICGHRERDHKDRISCKFCSCTTYQYSGGNEILTGPRCSEPETSAR
ncbi:MAG: hypothetical protein LAO55_25285 [Acidobacteriia bacterium]|nr:hypothetical protein [Terriglobia bacterium]